MRHRTEGADGPCVYFSYEREREMTTLLVLGIVAICLTGSFFIGIMWLLRVRSDIFRRITL